MQLWWAFLSKNVFYKKKKIILPQNGIVGVHINLKKCNDSSCMTSLCKNGGKGENKN